MKKKYSSWIVSIAVMLLVAGLDQWTKAAAFALLAEKNNEPIFITSFFNLVHVWNYGISFGLFQSPVWGVWIFSTLAAAIVIALLVWMKNTDSNLMRISIAGIIGGAIGNTLDRIRFGAVADFIDIHVQEYHWPAFNIADSAICIGVMILLWLEWHPRRTLEKKGK